MKKYLLGTVMALALTMPATAADKPWYIGIEAGFGDVDNTSAEFGNNNKIIQEESRSIVIDRYDPYRRYDTEYDEGFAGFITLGRRLGSNFRAELELGHRTNDLNETYWRYRCGDLVSKEFSGKLAETTFMLNVLYDLPLFSNLILSAGGGIGLDHAKFEVDYGKWSKEDTRNAFAYQGVAGLTYVMNERWDLMVNYRYLVADDVELNVGKYDDVLNYDFEKQSVTVGLRYKFGGNDEPVVVVPVATSVAPSEFIIYFGYDKCNITADADRVLAEAASAAKANGSASVRIVAHTDSMGSDSYNQKLSDCRAEATKSNLVSKGVSVGSILTLGKGESELLVSTGDQVKEPQNRRATINVSETTTN